MYSNFMAKILLGGCDFTSWIIQGFGLVKGFPPTVAKVYHAAGQVIFVGYFLVCALRDVSCLERIVLFSMYELTAVPTVILGLSITRHSRPRIDIPLTAVVMRKCGVCNVIQTPRTYHCRLCGFCIPALDHHCPWMNVCIGKHNRRAFIHFLFLCGLHGVVVAGCIYRHIYKLDIFHQWDLAVFFLFTISLLHGVAIFLMGVWQLFLVSRNQTTIEYLKGVTIYKRHLVHNFRETFGSSWLPALIPLFEDIRESSPNHFE